MNTFEIVTFMKSKYKASISDENLLSELRFSVNIKYTLDFDDLGQKI